MKTLKLSIVALCLFGTFTSCTKDSLQTSTASTASIESVAANSGRGGSEIQPADQPTNPGGGNSGQTGVGKTSIDPSLTVVYDPAVGIKGETVTVTGTFDETTGVAVPDCGKLQIMQLIDGDYVGVGDMVDVTPSNHEVTYEFTPEIIGDAAYSFKVHYIAAGCAGFSETKSEGFPLKVIEPCVSVFTAKGSAVGVPVAGKTGIYEFTVTFELTSPEDVANVKFQGGATAGGQSEYVLVDEGDFTIVNTLNQNTTLKWEGSLTKCQKKTLQFKFQRRFSCPATDVVVTGNWSAKVGEQVLAENVTAAASCQ